ncbi:DUF5082 domain-containing protein [Halobacillus fulvus]|nr:DUF5082 domain-containing protein [Halobacillus fulvus]
MLLESLFYYHRMQDQKQDEIRRLKLALSSLEGYREELMSQQNLCSEPELSAHTWAGQLAGEFENIRVNSMTTQYRAIGTEQMEQAVGTIQAKIHSLQSELLSIDGRITSIQYEMAQSEEK